MEDFQNNMEKIVDKDFIVRDIPKLFNLSIKTQINEIDNDKHIQMTFIEFLEAICRVIDKLSPIPYDDNEVSYYLLLG